MAVSQNPRLLKDVYPGTAGSSIQQIVKTTNFTFFNAEDDDPDLDRGLYRTDGTTAGTIKLDLVYPTYLSTKADKLTALGDKIIFAGDNNGTGTYGEIWASDGTQAGTVALERFQPTITNRGPVLELVAMGGYVYYSVVANNNKTQIRRTDGTPAGTSLVYEFSTYTTAPEIAISKVINNILYFILYDRYGTGYDQVWRSDGTTSGTYVLRDLGTEYFGMGYFMEPVNGKICFMTGKIDPLVFSNSISVLFSTDGTPAGTVPLKEFASTYNNNLYPAFASTGNTLYMAINDGAVGRELWKTDGSFAGTVLVADINSGSASSNPALLTVFNNQLYFSATTVAEGNELWKYDGSAASLVKDINPGPANSIGSMVVSNNTLVLRATTAASGSELWISDGTYANTQQVADINPGSAGSFPNVLTPGNPVYFSANNGIDGIELFIFDNSEGINGLHKIYVNDNSTSGDVFTTAVGDDANPGTKASPVATINYALSLAQAGDTIYVDAGTYPMENLTINKSITILGPNYNISPNNAANKTQYNSGRNAEAIIPNASFVVGADLITIKGLRFSLDKAIILSADYSHLKLDKNYFDVSLTTSSVNLVAVTTSPIVAFDFSITDNRFERTDLLAGISINIGAVKEVFIDNNVFIESPASGNPNRGTGLRTVSSLNVENIVFSNNYLKKLGTGVNNFLVQNFTVNNNIFDSCSAGYNHLPFNLVSNLVHVSANTFINSRTGRSILVRGGSAGGGVSNVTINNNIINQEVDGTNGYLGILQLDFGATGNFGSVAVLNNKINISGDYANTFANPNCGIFLMGKHSNTTVSANELNFSAINIKNSTFNILPPVPTGIYINTDNGAGGIPANGVINITNNKINGFKNSIGFYDPTATGSTSFVGYGMLTTGATVNINNNSFTNDSMSIDNGAISQDVFATCNWYGSTDAEFITSKLSTETVVFMPWLVNGTDNEPLSTGFQPQAGSCTGRPTRLYVNDNDQTGDVFTTAVGNDANSGVKAFPFATINYAISQAQAGDTIFVDAGTYNASSLTINKSVTILGANYLISPNDATNSLLPNAGRNAETIITNSTFTIGASNINFNGFSFSPGASSQFQQTNAGNDFDNIDISKNIFLVNSGSTVINFTGKQQLPLVTFNYTISTNRFIKYVSNFGANISLSAIDGIQISGNTFTVENSTANWKQSDCLGGAFRNNNFTVTNNTSYRQLNMFQGLNSNITQVSFNKAYECVRFILDFNGLNTPSVIDITDNEVTVVNSNGGPVISYSKSGGIDLSSPNIARIERNTVTANGTGWALLPQALIAPTVDNLSLNTEVYIRNNVLNISGDFSLQTDPNLYVSGIRFLNNSRKAVVENNDIHFTGTNYSTNNKYGIGTVNSGILPDAVYEFRNNNISGFPTSIAILNNGLFGNLPAGSTVNINNNSLTGDLISINNGNTGQTANATCNWYGSAAAQDVLLKVTPATVNYIPWLTNGIDNDLAAGFQPVPGSCNGTAVTVALTLATNINCFGQNTGAIDITAAGGTAPYNFVWTKSGDPGYTAATEDISNLTAGTYHLIVTDANSSVATLDVTLTEPAAALSINLTGTDITCFGNNNGSIVANVNGGTTPYSYLWSNGGTASSISGLAAGAYTVVVNDANGCNVSTGYNVLEPALLTVTITGTTASCNGSATATAEGGTTPYTYLWSNGATTLSISNVPAGLYTLVVTDANGCTANGSYTITGNSNINPSTSIVNVSCFGTATGSITVTGAGGVAPHTYNINGSAFQANNVFSNLLAGVYVIGVKDANGCSDFVTRTINEPTLLTVVLDDITRPCGGFGNGKIFITASGGSGGKTYSWTGHNGYSSTAQDPNNLFAGTYSLTVTDNKGCTVGLVVEVNEWPAISITETVTHVVCNGDFSGAIDATITGGTGVFTYSWTGPNGFTSANEDISGLKAGNYKITVNDVQSGCSLLKTIAVTQPATLNINTSKTNATGCASMGTITATGSGGTGTYMYRLNSGSYQSSGSFTNLGGGDYTVWVKDANGCTNTKLLTIGDNGKDEYENNNSKNQAKAITISNVVNARIAVSTDIDWFMFTTPAGTNTYTLSLTHPGASFIFNMYTGGNNTPALVPVNTTATTKEYVLSGNTTYYISVTGGLSYVCYELMVSPPLSFTQPTIITKETGSGNNNAIVAKNKPLVTIPANLSAKAYPNPHQGSFRLQINSPETGMAKIELFSINGQKLQEKTVSLQKGESNIVPFSITQYGTIIYRIQTGKYIVNGKVIGAN